MPTLKKPLYAQVKRSGICKQPRGSAWQPNLARLKRMRELEEEEQQQQHHHHHQQQEQQGASCTSRLGWAASQSSSRSDCLLKRFLVLCKLIGNGFLFWLLAFVYCVHLHFFMTGSMLWKCMLHQTANCCKMTCTCPSVWGSSAMRQSNPTSAGIPQSSRPPPPRPGRSRM
eukprot:355048-Chlamydomonas_euryale.AAC.4